MAKQNTYIVGNWKMYGSKSMADALLPKVAVSAKQAGANVVVCPPSVLIPHVAALARETAVQLGGQDCHAEKEGAFTGNTSAIMLQDAGCNYVIVGHSERRQYHHETNANVRAKAAQAMACGLIPIICIGETSTERDTGKAFDVISEQLQQSVPSPTGGRLGRGLTGSDGETNAPLPASPLRVEENHQFLLAYEPVWAIGSGRTPTMLDIKQMHSHIMQVLLRHTGGTAAVLYGGSVKASNAAEILGTEGVSGVLVGGASLKAEEFCGIIAAAAALKKD